MELTPTMKKQEISNTLQAIDGLIDTTNLSPEQAEQINVLKSEIENLIVDYVHLAEQVTENLAKEKSSSDVSIDSETMIPTESSPDRSLSVESLTLGDLEKIGVREGAYMVTPLENMGNIQRQVFINEQGIIVLKNAQVDRVGILNDLYVPSEYGELVKKIQSGVFTVIEKPAQEIITHETVPEVPQVMSTSIDPLTVEMSPLLEVKPSSQPMQVPTPEPISAPSQKSLAELLGSREDIIQENKSTLDINPVEIARVSPENSNPVSIESVKPIQPVQILPISLDKINMLEGKLQSPRAHSNVYDFISITLGKRPLEIYQGYMSGVSTTPTESSINTTVSPLNSLEVTSATDSTPSSVDTPVSKNIADLTLDDYQKSLTSSASGTNNKVDPLSMFN